MDVTPETLRRTNLRDATAGVLVNLEPALAYGGKVGGHLVQGHVDVVGVISDVIPEGNSYGITIHAPGEIMRYLVEKGFITVDGISLTVVAVGDTWFTIVVIPYTYENTTLGDRKSGDRVNLEVDILAKYTERLLREGSRDVDSSFP